MDLSTTDVSGKEQVLIAQDSGDQINRSKSHLEAVAGEKIPGNDGANTPIMGMHAKVSQAIPDSPARSAGTPAWLRPDQHTMRRLLSYIMQPGDVLELRIFGAVLQRSGFLEPADRFAATWAGWYDNPDALIVDACRAKGVNVFVTLNPVRRDLLARADNKLTKAKHTTTDDDIAVLRWVFVDIDPVRPADISSTNEELRLAIERLNLILEVHPELRDSALTGCSGNGAFAFIRVPDLPNAEENRTDVARLIKTLHEPFSDDRVKIDTSTTNPGRVAGLLGAWKCKGSSRPERPWRPSVLYPIPDGGPVPLALGDWLAENAPAAPAPQRHAAPRRATHGPKAMNRIAKYGSGAIDNAAQEVRGTRQGDRNNALFRASSSLGELIPSGAVSENEVVDRLTEAAEAAGLEPRDIARTIESGLSRGMAQPRDLEAIAGRPRPRKAAVAGGPEDGDPAELAEEDEGNPWPRCRVGEEDNPHRLARIFLRKYSHGDGSKLRFWNGEFHRWEGGAYQPVPKAEMRALVSRSTHDEFDRIYLAELMQSAMKATRPGAPSGDGPPKGDKMPRPFPVTTGTTSSVAEATASLCLLPGSEYPVQPCWLDGEGPWPISECVPMQNGIVHLPSLAAGKPCKRIPTPRLFAAHVVDYDFDPDAPEPTSFLGFLKSTFPDDPDSIALLQEWFGLQLVPDTRYQKMLALIGPPGTGKGTISRTMQALVGGHNCASIRFSMMDGDNRFCLASVIGKLCMIIPDARLSGKSDQAAILETLLSISGEDPLTIPRKFTDDWTGRLMARITLVSNGLPGFSDASSALSRRMLVLRFNRAPDDGGDKTLEAQIIKELPGIFRWAVEGWRRLSERGHFVQPDSGREELSLLRELSSPISTFLTDCADQGPDKSCRCTDAFRAWQSWCEQDGRKSAGDQATFGRNLRSVIPGLSTKNHREAGGFTRYFHGFTLKPPGEFTPSHGIHNGPDGGFVFDQEENSTPF